MSFFEKLLEKLPDAYNKKPNGVIGRVLLIVASEFDEIKKQFDKIEESRRIEKAVGKTLDFHGQDVRAERRGFNDVDYRKFIEIKIIANRSGGEIETLNEVLPVFLKDAFISVKEAWNLETYNNEPAAIVIRYDDEILFQELQDEYEETESDPFYFDGSFLFDGEKEFDGGIISPVETFNDRLRTIQQMKIDVNQIVAGGVRVYFEVPTEIESKVEIEQSPKTIINHVSENEIAVSNEVGQSVSNSIVQTPINRFDGSYYFNGHIYFNGERDFVVHDVDITEVSA